MLGIDEALGGGPPQSRDESLAKQSTLSVAAVRIESEAHHRPSVTYLIGDDRHDRDGHLRKVNYTVTDGRGNRNRPLTNVNDAHRPVSVVEN